MSTFTRAVFEPLDEYRCGRRLYRITNGLTYDIGFLGSGLSVVIPAGFVTDGPTMPRWMTKLLPIESMMKSAAIHDCLRENLQFSKPEGDAIFLTAMYAEKTPGWLRELAFLAVRFNNSRARAV